jgi:hypothetical protein
MSSIAFSRPMTAVSGVGMRDSGASTDAGAAGGMRDWSKRSARSVEGEIGDGVVGANAVDQLFQAIVAVLRFLDVDELGHGCRCEVVLVLEAGDLLVGGDPAVRVAVDADEHVGLGEIGAVERAGRVGARTELEHHRSEVEAFDGGAHDPALVGELTERGADEHAQPLIRGADNGSISEHHVRITTSTPSPWRTHGWLN